jgi:deoxyribodipyrimidine photo-lyase
MWFRRDLRLEDNRALAHALSQCQTVYGLFVFDVDILSSLPRADRRVEFIWESVMALDQEIKAHTSSSATHSPNASTGLIVEHDPALKAVLKWAQTLQVDVVYTNHDDEPRSLSRDAQVRGALAEHGIELRSYKDHVIFERSEVLSLSSTPFMVFTPYKNAWLKKFTPLDCAPQNSKAYPERFGSLPQEAKAIPSLTALGFEKTNWSTLGLKAGSAGAQGLWDDFKKRMAQYKQARDYPAIKGPSYLSVHLRFGTLSIRELARYAHAQTEQGCEGSAVWLSELIWRDFYHQIMHHHPRVVGSAFKPEYDRIEWEKGTIAKKLFAAWCDGLTGYPLVDAAMRQLNQTGYMHNRLRMVAASFLVKDLGIDWRWGEAYFAQHLNDFDLAANNGGWQWASSSGCDAQPYFRIFNPTTQSEKFDPQGKFIRRYVPELAKWPDEALHAPWVYAAKKGAPLGTALGQDYPLPIVDHALARETTLKRYAVVKSAKT